MRSLTLGITVAFGASQLISALPLNISSPTPENPLLALLDPIPLSHTFIHGEIEDAPRINLFTNRTKFGDFHYKFNNLFRIWDVNLPPKFNPAAPKNESDGITCDTTDKSPYLKDVLHWADVFESTSGDPKVCAMPAQETRLWNDHELMHEDSESSLLPLILHC
jgi:hypothetical protein